MTTLELLNLDFVRATLVACALLGVLSGVMAPLVVLRHCLLYTSDAADDSWFV